MRVSTVNEEASATPARNYQSEESFTKQSKIYMSNNH